MCGADHWQGELPQNHPPSHGGSPAAPPAEEGDYPVYVLAIAFDYDDDGETPADGINIRRNRTDDLGREGEALPEAESEGEWIADQPWEFDEVEKNDAAAYVAGRTPKLKVRFGYNPASQIELKSVMIRATTDSGVEFPSLGWEEVSFAAGENESKWIEFSGESALPAGIKHEFFEFTWESKSWVFNGSTDDAQSTLHKTGKHRIYRALDEPHSSATNLQTPWKPSGIYEPWTKALYFVIESPVDANGLTSEGGITTKIEEYLFFSHGMEYDTISGRGRYTKKKRWTKSGRILSTNFRIGEYIDKSDGSTVNCLDQAAALQSLASVVGVHCQVEKILPFGYLHPSYLVGKPTRTNNPFRDDALVVNDYEVPEDHVRRLCNPGGASLTKGTVVEDGVTKSARSAFAWHAVVTRDAGSYTAVHDACSAKDGGSGAEVYGGACLTCTYLPAARDDTVVAPGAEDPPHAQCAWEKKSPLFGGAWNAAANRWENTDKKRIAGYASDANALVVFIK